MANLLVVCDRDRDRLDNYLRKVKQAIAPVPGLAIGTAGCEGVGVVWAASDRTPISVFESSTSAGVVWGHAMLASQSDRVDAATLALRWRDSGQDTPEPLDGFYAAAHYSGDDGLTVAVDLLGLLPLYYTSIPNVFLAGSSPELFTLHSAFEPQLSLDGLAGLLLSHSVVDGQALLRNVRRLKPGHALRRTPDGRLTEIPQFSIPSPDTLSQESFDDQLDALDAALDRTVSRHIAGQSTVGLLLSGGRDTRLLGGYLRRAGCAVDAITFGSESDYEVQCARAAARRLGAAHTVVPLAEDAIELGATLQTQWEHLASGFSTIHTWGMVPALADRTSPMVNGYLAGRVLGGAAMISEHGRFGQSLSFDRAFPLCCRIGVPQPTLTGLMSRGGDHAVDAAYERLRHIYDAPETAETQRVWRFALTQLEPFHAGAVPWHLTFGAWPVMPILDQRLLTTIGSMHPWTLANRRAQDQLLCTRFPDLAAIILDRNSHNIDPLLPSIRYRLGKGLARLLAATRLRRARSSRLEPRYYYRVYDLNSEAWRSIRRRAEPYRDTLADIFDMDVLRTYLPCPEEFVELPDAITDGFGRKLLLGLMLWRGRLGI